MRLFRQCRGTPRSVSDGGRSFGMPCGGGISASRGRGGGYGVYPGQRERERDEREGQGECEKEWEGRALEQHLPRLPLVRRRAREENAPLHSAPAYPQPASPTSTMTPPRLPLVWMARTLPLPPPPLMAELPSPPESTPKPPKRSTPCGRERVSQGVG